MSGPVNRGDLSRGEISSAEEHTRLKELASGNWQLAEDRQLEPTGLLPLRKAESFVYRAGAEATTPPAEQTPLPESADKPASTVRPAVQPAVKGSGPTALRAYNYAAMAAYLERYWSSYNSAYRSFSDVGGDCTNFASQALRAGGWAHDLGWYRSAENWWYNSSNETWSWINVNFWASFAYTYRRSMNQVLADWGNANYYAGRT